MTRLTLALAALAACSPPTGEPPRTDTAETAETADTDTGAPAEDCAAPDHVRDAPSEAVASAAVGVNGLGLGLLRARADENPFLSPLSVATALGMTLAGAEGTTADELRAALGGDGGDAVLHEGLAGLTTALIAAPASNTSDCASWSFDGGNAAFLDARLGILDPYVAILTDPYSAPPQIVDYRNDPQGAADTINAWASEKTGGSIHDIADPAAYDYHTLLVLANALRFGGSWEEPFPGDATATRDFTLADGTTREATFMQGIGARYWAELDGAWAVALPYRGGDLDMVLVVPFQHNGLDAVLATLDPAALSHEALVPHGLGDITVTMPKWEVRSDASLVAALERLGVHDAFDPIAADLSGIAPPPPEFDNLVVADVVHAAWVRVDEAGTEASAATTVEVEGTDSEPPWPSYVTADRPFAYVIRDRVTGAWLFAGRMDAPPVEADGG